jgi:hypothetical protein
MRKITDQELDILKSLAEPALSLARTATDYDSYVDLELVQSNSIGKKSIELVNQWIKDNQLCIHNLDFNLDHLPVLSFNGLKFETSDGWYHFECFARQGIDLLVKD